MGKLTISMAIFNSYVSHYQRVDKTIFGNFRMMIMMRTMRTMRMVRKKMMLMLMLIMMMIMMRRSRMNMIVYYCPDYWSSLCTKNIVLPTCSRIGFGGNPEEPLFFEGRNHGFLYI